MVQFLSYGDIGVLHLYSIAISMETAILESQVTRGGER